MPEKRMCNMLCGHLCPNFNGPEHFHCEDCEKAVFSPELLVMLEKEDRIVCQDCAKKREAEK